MGKCNQKRSSKIGGFHMELTGKRFCMVSDKEQMLQILNMNNVPSVELVDPKTSKYPIIGRKYGHHSGKDLTIINTPEQVMDEGLDYFTKLYAFEREYCFEIQALTVKSVRIAVGQQIVFYEIPIRTEAFGYHLQETDTDSLPIDWLNIAIRALYVMGLSNGMVKMGMLSNESVHVIDINLSNTPNAEPDEKATVPFTMGADVEFMLSCDGELLPASTFFPIVGEVGCDERQIEQDSGEYALAEIRPEKAETPHELFDHIKELIVKASKMAPYENVEFRAGSMPFSGYQCGGHIHFGMPLSLSLLRALDQFLAIPVAMVEDPRTAKLRRKTKHGGLGRYRVKSYGFEYLSLSSWIIDPKLTLAILCLAMLVAAHHQELESDFLFDPLVQRAYYHGNHILLKQLWGDMKPMLMKTSSYSQFENELSFLFEAIENGYPFTESTDIRLNWGIPSEKETYERGLIIQIPKKTRLKYNLKEGLTAKVCAGKRISSATIQAYPFSFRNSNMVQLSKALREKLALPKNWNPKLVSANGVLTLGPIIGILAAQPFDRQKTYFQHLCRLAFEKQMLLYIFEAHDIDWNQQMIKGTTINGEGVFPFPAVIYDRFFLGGEKKVDIDEVRAKLQSIYHIPFVNSMPLFQLTGNKWECHQLLAKNHEDVMPDSRLLQDSSDITQMLDNYGEIFLKPVGGALSMGVIRVIRRPAGIYWFDMKRRSFQQLQNMDELFAFIESLMGESPYLIQEGIRRKQFNGKNLEIRVYMQKNGQQIWFRTGMVARLTNEDVLTEETETNMRLSKVLNHLYPDPTERRYLTNQLAAISKDIVDTIENEVGAFGELAVDLCIDQYNFIKLLEINSKPDNLFSQIRAYQLRNLAGIRLLNYASSLAGYQDEEHKL